MNPGEICRLIPICHMEMSDMGTGEKHLLLSVYKVLQSFLPISLA